MCETLDQAYSSNEYQNYQDQEMGIEYGMEDDAVDVGYEDGYYMEGDEEYDGAMDGANQGRDSDQQSSDEDVYGNNKLQLRPRNDSGNGYQPKFY